MPVDARHAGRRRVLGLCCVLTMFSCTDLQAQKVTDPRASLFDVAARQALLRGTTDPRIRSAIERLPSCVAMPVVEPPQGEMFIPPHYLEDSHGPTNPAEAAATKVYGAFATRITSGMNRWVAAGDDAEARCALEQMDRWARGNALLNYSRDELPQAWFQVEWTLSAAAITESVLVNDPKLEAASQQRVIAWLDAVSHKDISFERPNDSQNNHHYWRGMAAAAVGVVAADNKLFRFGLSAYKGAVDDLDRQGAFPKEMARHELALHYQGFALDPLIATAEFAERQGVDLYAYSAHGRTLRDAVVFFGRALDDPELVRSYAHEDQKMDFRPGSFAGVEFYVARFGAEGLPPSLTKGLLQPVFDANLGGSATVMAAK